MKIISLNLNNINTEILEITKDYLTEGKTVVIPTDTCYGLAANPNIKIAMDMIFKIKKREPEKLISCVYKDIDQVKKWCTVSYNQEVLLKTNLPGAFTFLLSPNNDYPLEGETVGVRIPNFEFTNKLSNILDFPYTSTSANLAGQPSCYSVEELLNQINNESFQPDLIIDAGKLPYQQPSTVVDIRDSEMKILREGSGHLKLS
jgi:tRNA threonylcarbamoyl adenosine modification protein (Sua5/YciO/YrdC/YwlC family)